MTTLADTPTTTGDLRELAGRALDRCGADVGALAGRSDPGRAEPDHRRGRGHRTDGRHRGRRGGRPGGARGVPGVARRARTGARRAGQAVRASCSPSTRSDLADLITIEVGKIRSEALGEVQEMIDICDFAVGLSRQLDGRTMPSERPGHRLMETWHPLGVVGVISAFNFPAAVWAWNTAVALVCGDTVVWKPSELTPLTVAGLRALLGPGRRGVSALPRDLNTAGASADADGAAPLDRQPAGARSSAPPGRSAWGRRSRRGSPPASAGSLLELGGNNAAVVAPSADLDLAVRGIVFAAAGTAGQRCTTLRRLIVHESRRRHRGRAASPSAYRKLPDRQPVRRRRRSSVRSSTRRRSTAMQPGAGRGRGRRRQWSSPAASAVDTGDPEAYYVRPALVRMPGADRRRAAGDVRADPVRADLLDLRRGRRAAQRRPAGPVVEHLHPRPAGGRAVPRRRRLRLRHRQRQHRHVRRGDRRRVRRREDHRRRPRVRLGRLARLHAPGDQHRQLLRPSCPLAQGVDFS